MQSVALLTLLTLSAPGDSVDSLLAQAWKQRGLEPAPLASDEEFLRRVTLDLIGRIPNLEEIERFRSRPDRRAKIDDLLASDDFPRYWSELLTLTLIGYGNGGGADREVFRIWLEDSIRDNVPYDRLAWQMISAKGESAFDGPTNFLVRYPDDPLLKVSRLFLGVRLDCARCHDHPFDRWKQDDLTRMVRFFEGTSRQEMGQGNIRLVSTPQRRSTDDERPRFLSGALARTPQWRDELALFVTSSKPFARTYVNRFWYLLMGRGIVNPPDDLNRQNTAAVPELLDYLTQRATDDRFAIRALIREICNSQAYQLSARDEGQDPAAEAVFAVRVLKPLIAEQMFDSLSTALEQSLDGGQRAEFIQRMMGDDPEEDFSETWQYRETVQALMTRLNTNLVSPTQSLDELFLRVFTRLPDERERKLCEGKPLDDVAFALINSNEFFFSH